MLLELELELELELLLEFELELLLEFELELLLEFELELLLELELWFELEFELWFELELELWFELPPDRLRSLLDWRLIVRRFETARARHHSIGLPSIFCLTVTTRTGAVWVPTGAFAAVRAAFRWIGASSAWLLCERAESGSRAEPTARPRPPNTPA
ncbi:MAG TPA: hypothetical protein VGW30_07225 [Gaiellaceae bacterium]|nr:hypothetical protein [Gaiellaceae bacterium]